MASWYVLGLLLHIPWACVHHCGVRALYMVTVLLKYLLSHCSCSSKGSLRGKGPAAVLVSCAPLLSGRVYVHSQSRLQSILWGSHGGRA